jgi:DNA-binding transcriptional ArsR family regulator
MTKVKVGIDSEKLSVAADLMRALAHPLRLKIVGFLDQNPDIHVNKIYNTLRLEQSITSQHLKILRESNVVIAERDGKFIHYSLNYPLLKRTAAGIKAYNNYLKSLA